MLLHQKRIIGITPIAQKKKTTCAKMKHQDRANSTSTYKPGPEKYAVVKQSKKMTKMNPKKDKLIRLLLFELLHDVILCFWNSVTVFRIYDWKKFQHWFNFLRFFSKLVFSKCYFLGRRQKYLKNTLSNQFEIFRPFFPHKHYTISGKNMSSIDPN